MENKMLEAVKEFRNAAEKLQRQWLRLEPDASMRFAEGYPFKEDFDSVLSDIQEWFETVEKRHNRREQLYEQLRVVVALNEKLEEPISFVDNDSGQMISNPFVSPCMRMTVDPIDTYGIENLLFMLKTYYSCE